jgi:hypothetical protein
MWMPDEEREKLEVIEQLSFREENMKGLSEEDRVEYVLGTVPLLLIKEPTHLDNTYRAALARESRAHLLKMCCSPVVPLRRFMNCFLERVATGIFKSLLYKGFEFEGHKHRHTVVLDEDLWSAENLYVHLFLASGFERKKDVVYASSIVVVSFFIGQRGANPR